MNCYYDGTMETMEPHPASATVALVQMQQALADGEFQSSGVSASSSTRELRSGSHRTPSNRPTNFIAPLTTGTKRRKVEAVHSSTSVVPQCHDQFQPLTSPVCFFL